MNSYVIHHKENTFHLEIRPFDVLTSNELYDILRIRQEIFVVEQNCAFVDADLYDKQALHLILKNNDKDIIAYARIVDKGIIYPQATIGRVLTVPSYRSMGFGHIIFKEAIEQVYTQFGKQDIKIQAQSYLVPFYTTYQFVVLNEAYLDTGILHNDMMRYA